MQPVEVPRVFSERYELTHLVARGGMAEVYRARDRLLDRPVALKVLFPELSVDRAFVERFRREAQAAAKLSHPNIVPVFDWGEDAGAYFIVMEYVEGRPLSALLRERGPLEPVRAAEIASQVAAALASAHRHGVVHRDIKPGNVLITDDGQVKVTDFGIARAINTEDSLTQTGAVMGTATYFSPEQAEGLSVDARSDIYSLGVVLFEMLTGRPPFLGDTPVSVASKHVRDAPPTPRELLETVPVELEAVVMKAMAKQPAQRYQGAEDFQADLVRFVEGRPVEAGPANGNLTATHVMGAVPATSTQAAATRALPTTPRREAGHRRRWGWFAILVILLAALAVVAYLLVSSLTGGFALPDVVGKPLVQAERILTAKGLVIGTTTNRVNPAPPGTVIRTDPPPGARVSKHAVVNLVVSTGDATVKVPNVVGLDLASAEAVLTNSHLGYKVQFVQSNAQQNFVLSQSPGPGTTVRRGSKVIISIPQPTNQVTVPNLIGLTPGQAAAELGGESLSVGSQTQACSNTYPSGQISGSSPPGGASVARGTSVNLVISSGPCQVVVENVVGQNATDATNTLKGQGLTVAQTTTNACTAANDGNVVSQNPSAGTQVNLPATVTITVCSAPAPPSTTTTTAPGTGGPGGLNRPTPPARSSGA
jgi:beta-lactam-binding protein with PASTA domain/tRNA A-37 threonylcarbamoyl transferase component Bud32